MDPIAADDVQAAFLSLDGSEGGAPFWEFAPSHFDAATGEVVVDSNHLSIWTVVVAPLLSRLKSSDHFAVHYSLTNTSDETARTISAQLESSRSFIIGSSLGFADPGLSGLFRQDVYVQDLGVSGGVRLLGRVDGLGQMFLDVGLSTELPVTVTHELTHLSQFRSRIGTQDAPWLLEATAEFSAWRQFGGFANALSVSGTCANGVGSLLSTAYQYENWTYVAYLDYKVPGIVRSIFQTSLPAASNGFAAIQTLAGGSLAAIRASYAAAYLLGGGDGPFSTEQCTGKTQFVHPVAIGAANGSDTVDSHGASLRLVSVDRGNVTLNIGTSGGAVAGIWTVDSKGGTSALAPAAGARSFTLTCAQFDQGIRNVAVVGGAGESAGSVSVNVATGANCQAPPSGKPDLVARPGGQPDYLIWGNIGTAPVDVANARIHIYYSLDANLDRSSDCRAANWTFGQWFASLKKMFPAIAFSSVIAPGRVGGEPAFLSSSEPTVALCGKDFIAARAGAPFFYIYELDPDGQIDESDESNNVIAKSSVWP